MQIKVLIVISYIIGINLLFPAKNMACPIPVFRYALEYWEPDSYRLEIFYKNSLSPGEEELVNYLFTASGEYEGASNYIMRTVNIESDNQDIPQNILNDLSAENFPLMVLRYPFNSGINTTLWSASLNSKNVDLLFNSPARESIAGKLVEDVTAVWVLLESGDRRKDRDALDLLNRELNRLEQTLTLPAAYLWLGDYHSGSGAEVPEIKFDIVRVSRDDPHEEFLVKMLMNTEHYLDNFKSEPIVFPIYGRGIALWAIIGDRIDEFNIARAAEFLTGPCSCQVKDLNPGDDLLISMDWDNLVDNIADISIANPLSGMGDFSSRETEVRRKLESATHERLGTTDKMDQSRGTDSGKAAYLDVFGDSRQEDQDGVTERTDETTIGQKEKEHGQEVPAYNEIAQKGSSKYASDQTSQRIDFMNIPALFLAGVIVLVLIGGIVLYWKNIK